MLNALLPSLGSRTFVDQSIQNVVADLSAALGRTDAGLLNGLSDNFCCWPVVNPFGYLVQSIAFTSLDGCHDSRASRLVSVGRAISKANVELGIAMKVALQLSAEQNTRASMNGTCPLLFAAFCRWSNDRSFLAFELARW